MFCWKRDNLHSLAVVQPFSQHVSKNFRTIKVLVMHADTTF